MIDPPAFAQPLIEKIALSTGLPSGRTWVDDRPSMEERDDVRPSQETNLHWDNPSDGRDHSSNGYAFAGPGTGGKALKESRTRSGSFLSRNKTENGPTSSSTAADNVVSRARGNSVGSNRSDEKPPGSPSRPGFFSSVSSSFTRKRGKSNADHTAFTTSESYTQSDRLHSGSPSGSVKSLPYANAPSYPPYLQRNPSNLSNSPLKVSTPKFAQHFANDSDEETDSDAGRSGYPFPNAGKGSGSDSPGSDSISWDNGPLSSDHSAQPPPPRRPSYLPSSLSNSYTHRLSTDTDTDTDTEDHGRYSIDAPDPHPYSSNTNDWDAPIQTFNPPAERTDRLRAPAASRVGESMMEEDWGSLGAKARIGLGRTRSGSEAAALAASNSFGGLIPTLGALKLTVEEPAPLSAPSPPTVVREESGAGELEEMRRRFGVVGRARAKFDFEGVQPGDLQFRKGETVWIVRLTDKKNDWSVLRGR